MKKGESSSTGRGRGTGKRNANKGKVSTNHRDRDDVEEERRRERARESQRNFHLRRQAKFGTLEQRINSLEDTIEQMSNVFIGFGDRVVAKSESTAKPVILEDLKKTTEQFLDLARAMEPSSDQEDPRSETSLNKKPRIEPLSGSQPEPMNLVLDLPYDPFDFDALFTAATPSLTSHAICQIDTQTRSQNSFQYSGAFNPRFDYGFFGTGSSLAQPTPTPQIPWLTYLISGPSSFAMRLYIDSTVLVFNVLRGAQSIPGFIPMIQRFRFRHEHPQTLMEKLRYQFRKMNIDVDNAESLLLNTDEMGKDESGDGSLILFGPADWEMLDRLRLKILRDYTQELGGRLDEWLDPWATQQYLSTDWGLRFSFDKVRTSKQTLRSLEPPVEDVSFQAPELELPEIRWWDTSPSSTPSYGEQVTSSVRGNLVTPQSPKEEVEINSQQLARKLTFHAVCFGEGPRYPKSGIDQAVRELVGEAYLPSSSNNSVIKI